MGVYIIEPLGIVAVTALVVFFFSAPYLAFGLLGLYAGWRIWRLLSRLEDGQPKPLPPQEPQP
jgi:hypothetical protein